VFTRIGEAANPGPAVLSKFVSKPKQQDLFIIESKNVTNLETHLSQIAKIGAGLQFLQEHSAPKMKHPWLKQVFKDYGKQIHLSDLDKQADHNLGGVATICARRKAIGVIEPRTDAFKAAKRTGRANITVVPVTSSMQLATGNLYCYTGGNKNGKQLKKTNKLVTATVNEMSMLAGKFQMLVGDFNADIEKIDACKDLLSKGWVDVGAAAQIWGKHPCEFTCLTANSKKGSRRDFILVSPEVFPLIKTFEVDHANDLPTHSTLRIGTNPPQGQQVRRCIQQPISLLKKMKNSLKRCTLNGQKAM
jgi:exonuclease III